MIPRDDPGSRVTAPRTPGAEHPLGRDLPGDAAGVVVGQASRPGRFRRDPRVPGGVSSYNAEIRSRKLGDIFRSRFLGFRGDFQLPLSRVSHQSSSILSAPLFLNSRARTAAWPLRLTVSPENSGIS